MGSESRRFGLKSISQQGYECSASEFRELDWALRFTPFVCMVLAIWGLATQQPAVHILLAAMGIGSFWFPAWHPFDLLYNYGLRPLWGGVKLPPNPLPRRIACLMGGLVNAGIGAAFVLQVPAAAYLLGAVLIPLQVVVITTHFCVASWMFDGLLKVVGQQNQLMPLEDAHDLVRRGAYLIDVRPPHQFARLHLTGAVNIPLSQIEQHSEQFKHEKAVFYCQAGIASQRAVQILKDIGCEEVYNLGALKRAASEFGTESAE